jgi:hypothetical protein
VSAVLRRADCADSCGCCCVLLCVVRVRVARTRRVVLARVIVGASLTAVASRLCCCCTYSLCVCVCVHLCITVTSLCGKLFFLTCSFFLFLVVSDFSLPLELRVVVFLYPLCSTLALLCLATVFYLTLFFFSHFRVSVFVSFFCCFFFSRSCDAPADVPTHTKRFPSSFSSFFFVLSFTSLLFFDLRSLLVVRV